MLAYFKITVLLKGFVQSGHGRSGENFEKCRDSRAMFDQESNYLKCLS